ncbi:MAG: hypothetical protein JSS63_10895 [Bacteroidetes bacterium]|nr:hypothetical protein [Bacteroidota bacterium]
MKPLKNPLKEQLENIILKKSLESSDFERKLGGIEERKTNWTNAITHLYSNVLKWLEPLSTQKSKIRIERYPIIINEDFIGEYHTEKMTVSVGFDKINFIPVGTNIIGAVGRIDLIGPNTKLLLILKNWNTWEITDYYNKNVETKLTKTSFYKYFLALIK